MADRTEIMTDARLERRAAMRRATLHLVLGVVLLDAFAMLCYYAAVAHASNQVKMIFTGVWMLLTAFTVALLLKRVRKARHGLMTR